ncbi:unnamed protein product [Didymodactylos carnosus]|uniref:F-BAR domain-containing protein n=1 Tax=Didymodactylos carnosus TaxID=1234261 RepID=A0A814RRX5_9BILA|nr:unnamed protein product [Didymodactylos carnosus]CAF1565298.1 unnamed protein product [Didymodactylos carnosus]CAF3900325.1 unnamed protein product [Didymodactylos carnosus]CAF4358232.1 unnamed protein product [Didymodactylos carnosus]
MSASINTSSTLTKSFFEPGQYLLCIKRYEFGNELIDRLLTMFDERSHLELSYVNALRNWSRKWHAELVKQPEYVTNKKVWDQTVTTGEQMADIHQTIISNLNDSIVPKLRQWRKDNYEKSLIHYKKSKEYEKEFENVQKPWNKVLELVQENKRIYHDACRLLQNARQIQRNMNLQVETEEQQKAVADKLVKATIDVDNTKTRYEKILKDLQEQRQRYEANMIECFNHTQVFEKKRLDFFKEVFQEYQRTLDSSNATKKMYDDYQMVLKVHDVQNDLQWWNAQYGPIANVTHSYYPTFEEYQEKQIQ